MYVYVCVYVCMCVCVYVYVLCMHVYMYCVCMCVSMYIHTRCPEGILQQEGTQFRTVDAARYSLQNVTVLKPTCAFGQ